MPKRKSSDIQIGRRELVVLLALMMSLNALAIDAMLPLLDEMARDLAVVDENRRQLVVGVYTIAMGVGALLPGSFADRFGRRPVILTSLAAYCALSLISAFLTDFEVLLWVRGITGVLCAGLMVMPMTIVRDIYEGDAMARLMSLVSAVFITVPVVAPSLGAAIAAVAGWRFIFVGLAVMGGVAATWVWFRLPETLTEDNRQHIDVPVIVRNMRLALINRQAVGYVFGAALLMGGVFGYVNSAQQLYQDFFGVGAWFPVLFGGTAAMMAFSSLVNSRIVMRFGARRVSHAGTLMFIVVSATQVWSSYAHPGNIYWFLPLMSVNLGLLGFLGANFSSIAMQPFSTIAGAASSVQTFFRMFGAAMVGVVIGQAYDGTALPFAWSLLGTSVAALLLVLFSERGVLFRRLHQVPQSTVPVR
ncbi:MFS transporter [Aurantiacibacter xanthus]|uniref:MFS transporter n=1 Tax=Aurantiacibacter xanthus TaxID=1784712 RepID=A0A3A1PKL2_9SPHN|nr:multidrug effflux MFS transporter [Aurantiacibacter xanthus]RIV93327.1 MFS transporter [Aurantiacibacter xanthus]